MKTALGYKYIDVRFQGRQVDEFFNFQLQRRGNQPVLYCEYKDRDGDTRTYFKYLYPWRTDRISHLSDRPSNFQLPGGKLEKFNIINGIPKLAQKQKI